ncbi:MAG: hypothetical protein AYK18_03970 [Theionarchaea archaeon DG-70]|nr:MAG: hypothetical protein AYK18_03970 [Theionarchaea archaeon DG-70]
MNRVCLLTRGEYGTGVQEIIEKYGKKNVISQTWEMKGDLPPILEEGEISLPDFENCDLILSYVMHPDVNLDIINVLKSSEKVLLMPHHEAPLPPGYHVYGNFLVGVLSPCCVIPPFENKILSVFREEFGTPSFHITTKDGRICEVEVVRHTRCGAADFVAENLVGVPAKEAYTKAGLLAQYHCQSSKGPLGSIHDAGKVHAEAVKKALKR